MTNWSQVQQIVQEECLPLCPGPDRVGVMLERPAQALICARWLFPGTEIRLLVLPERPDQMEIHFQIPSLMLTDAPTSKHFREMIFHANSVSIQPADGQLAVKMQFHHVWLERQAEANQPTLP